MTDHPRTIMSPGPFTEAEREAIQQIVRMVVGELGATVVLNANGVPVEVLRAVPVPVHGEGSIAA